MKTFGIAVCGAALSLGAHGLLFGQAPAGGHLRAGAAKVDITPRPDQLAIATDSIRDHLFVRAIVVDDGRTCAALVNIDGGARDAVVNPAIAKSSASAGCPPQNYIISGTHSHSASTGGLGGAGFPNPDTIVAAIVSAVDTAKLGLAPARIGYGTAQVDLNVNRDLYNSRQEWRQGPNPQGSSDKTLAVVEFVGDDDVPIGVYMNYAMHPINFYLSGVISADFPGEASKYIEELFDHKTVAVFSQGASGDQNPRLGYTQSFNVRANQLDQRQTVGPPQPRPEERSARGFNAAAAGTNRQAVPPEKTEAYKKAIARTGEYVVMLGQMIATTAVRVMREDIKPVNTATIWAGQEGFSCPGRVRLDAANPARENVFPGYKDGPDVNLKVGLLRIGDINFVTVNGEIYSQIGIKLKDQAPANKTVVVTLANGAANSGYIYSDDAYNHLTFQVIGSRLKPGCAEGKIISTAIGLMRKSGE
ncbi:MAG: neutral/alkaline non-lysosomal ceramidase N-terminal domain-containing protein [Acidobacteriota bacterium]|nr:neutral/alkaline non-lysosomal ceramidase N-terminal domain-containing protein [Acidobacteriota bacterium]